ncbi:hypothetical protein TGAMA5MH_08304 [Trichoderma gamsii]|uniref:Uncharacterized protein n=1 Tax=Trichoderma gamsii TaxID=398673 RepID=A0A2K0T2Q8_9HYPO|nr:hypothetical protein TGAMA5MH_08304 [Trichoderma gamsii]
MNTLDSQPRGALPESDFNKPSPRLDANSSLKRKAEVESQGSQMRPRHSTSRCVFSHAARAIINKRPSPPT